MYMEAVTDLFLYFHLFHHLELFLVHIRVNIMNLIAVILPWVAMFITEMLKLISIAIAIISVLLVVPRLPLGRSRPPIKVTTTLRETEAEFQNRRYPESIPYSSTKPRPPVLLRGARGSQHQLRDRHERNHFWKSKRPRESNRGEILTHEYRLGGAGVLVRNERTSVQANPPTTRRRLRDIFHLGRKDTHPTEADLPP
jgi:hypothetical protein